MKRTIMYHLPADRSQFEVRLREAFPQICFVSIPRWTLADEPEVLRLNSMLDNRYYAANLYAWIEPQDWKPQWSLDPLGEPWLELECSNIPERSVYCGFLPEVREDFKHRPLRGGNGTMGWERCHVLAEVAYVCRYHKDDVEGRRFAERVMRLLRKDATNLTYSVCLSTGLPSTPVRRDYYWIGNHAKAWVQAAPNRLCHDHLRPAADIDTYRWDLPVDTDVVTLPASREGNERWLQLQHRLLKRRWLFTPDHWSESDDESRP